MSRWFLVEDDDPSMNFSNGEVAALSPWAAHSLKSRKQPYKILEDFYSETAMRENEDVFFEKQLASLDRFDAFLSERIPAARERGWKLASIHRNRLKYLIDSFLIRYYVAENFLDAVRPSSIEWIAGPRAAEPNPSLYEFKRHDRWSYAPLLKALAQSRGISWVERLRETAESTPPGGRQKSSHAEIKRLMKRLRNYFFFKKFTKNSRSGRFPVKSILFLDAGIFSFDSLIRNSIRDGHRVYLKQGNFVTALHEAGEPVSRLGLPENPSFNADFFRIGKDFFESAVFKELVVGKTGIEELLKPYFSDFLLRIVPETVRESLAIEEWMRAKRIDAVVARACAGVNYPSALLAAGSLKIPRICYQHSAGPGDMKAWLWDELAFFDHSLALTTPLAECFKEEAKANVRYRHCKTGESSEPLHEFGKKPYSSDNSHSLRPRIMYVPAKLAGGMSHFNTVFYPMTWYYEHQVKLLSYLATRTEYEIIYKHADGQNWADRSIIAWLRDYNAPNIRIVQGIFPDFIGEADRVLFDYPSTGFFESAVNGVPVLALHHETMKILPRMRTAFGYSLQMFQTSEEAVEKIGGFLNRPGWEFCPKLALASGSGYEQLKEILAASIHPEKKIYV